MSLPNNKMGTTGWSKFCLVTLVLGGVFAGGCKTQSVEPVDRTTTPYGWTLNNNQRARLTDYKGKVVVLDFYATWCEPCRAETPHLVKMHQQYAPQGLQIIGLNVGGEDDHDKIPGYAKELGIQYQLGLPDDGLVDEYLGDNETIPQAFVFDRSGRMVKRFVGYNEATGREMENVAQASLAAGP